MNDQPKTQEEIIIAATSTYFGLDIEAFRTPTESNYNAVYKRMLCMFIIKESTFLSYRLVGELFKLSESTAKSSIKRIRGLSTVDKRTVNDLNQIQLIIDSFTEKNMKSFV